MLVALVILVLFGRGKVADFMGEFGKGIKSFKQGMNEEGQNGSAPPPAQLTPAQLTAPQLSAQPPAANAPVQPTLNGEPVPEQHGQR